MTPANQEPEPEPGSQEQPRTVTGSIAAARVGLLQAVDVVRGRLNATTYPLQVPGAGQARRRRQELLDQIDDYLLPRLRASGAPLLVVVGGSTGAGKSTLVNSLLGAPLTRPGVLRPTTRSPVLVHHPSDAPWFAPGRVLPTLIRDTSTTDDGDAATPRTLRLAPFPGMPPGLALLDPPDIDSIETANRDLAAQLLAAADLWLFVTTAARYADAVPWELLHTAAQRRAQVALVLDRVDPGAQEVAVDLARLARAHGLGEAPLFVLPEVDLDEQGLLPARAVAELAGWLTDLGGSARARAEIALATRDGVVADLVASLEPLAVAAEEQLAATRRLTAVVDEAYGQAQLRVREASSDGALLRGEVLQRWQDFVGASDVMRSIERGVGRLRDRLGSMVRGAAAAAQPVELALAHGLQAVTLDAIESAREQVRAAWRADPAGAALVDQMLPAGTSADLRAAIAEQVRGWQDDVLTVVREQGEDRRGLAKALSFGVNGLGLAVMMLVFAGTGGVTGIEVGVAGGTAVLAQKVLEAAFGDDAVRRLTAEAARRLDRRLGALLAGDATTALTAVTALGVADSDGPALRRAAAEVAACAAEEHSGRAANQDTGIGVPQVGGAPALRGAELRHLGPLAPYALSPGRDAGSRTSNEDLATTEQPASPGFWRRLFGGGR